MTAPGDSERSPGAVCSLIKRAEQEEKNDSEEAQAVSFVPGYQPTPLQGRIEPSTTGGLVDLIMYQNAIMREMRHRESGRRDRNAPWMMCC